MHQKKAIKQEGTEMIQVVIQLIQIRKIINSSIHKLFHQLYAIY